MRRSVLLFLIAVPLFSQLYEEDPVATKQLRIDLYKQMDRYATALSETDGLDGFLNRIEARRNLLRQRIGYPPPGFTTEQAEMRTEKIGEDSIATYYRTWLPVAKGMDAYGLYIVPKAAAKPAPLVIAQHGGGGFPEMATFKGGANYHDMVRGAVAEGYIVYAPHLVMYPFRDRDKGTDIPVEVRGELDEKLRACGTSLFAVEIAKISRALDVLLKRQEIDPERVAMIGLSYGGYYTMYTAALEPRIKVAVASCSFRDTPEERMVSTEGRPFDMSSPDMVALIVPRPLQVQNGINDKGLPIEDVRRAVARTVPYYKDLGLEDRFDFQAFDGVHEWRGDIAWQFLRKHLK